MLTPAYLAGVSSEVVEIFAEVEQEIANDMVKRIVKYGTVSDYTQWQYLKARQLGMFQNGVNDVLQKASIKAGRDVKRLMAQAAKDGLAYDDSIYKLAGLSPKALSKSPALMAIVLQGTDDTLKLLSNFTKTSSIASSATFSAVLDKTYIKILSGAYSPDTAILSAIKEIGQNGINQIPYQGKGGGVYYQGMESSVRRAVTTGINQSISKLQLARADEMGCELVEVTAHSGARPSHAEWQGQVYSLTHSRSDYPDFYDSTGYGTGEGLCGWNCYHSFFPFFDGLSTRSFSDDPSRDAGHDNDEDYELQQKQRYYERQIRSAKKEVATWEATVEAAKANGKDGLAEDAYAEFQRVSVKLKRREAALNHFLAQNGLRRDWIREQTGGWGRSLSMKASWANRKARK